MGDCQKAIPWFQQLLTEPRALYYLGCCFAHTRDYERALQCFSAPKLSQGEYAERAQLQLAHVQFHKGDTELAKEVYLCLESISPGNPDVLYGLGCVFYRVQDFTQARACFSRIIGTTPDHAAARFAVGAAAEREGDHAAAVDHYQRLISSANCPAAGQFRLAVAYCRQASYELALPLLEQLRQCGLDSDSLLFYLGMSQLYNGKVFDSIQVWETLEHRHPDDEDLALNVARVTYLLGMEHAQRAAYQDAAQAWEKYVSKVRTYEEIARDLGQVYFRLATQEIRSGSILRAREFLLKSLDHDSGNPCLHEHARRWD